MEAEPDRANERDAAEKGYFFQTGGAIRFSDAEQEVPGYASTITVADRYGFVAYSDLAAVYIAFTNQLLKAASSEVKRPPVLDPATVCVSKLPVQNVVILSLSADQLLLACVAGSTVQVYSLPALLHHQSDVPVHSMNLSKELMQFSWCPESSARDSTSFLAVSSDHVLLYGSLVSGSGTLAEGVECACWSPDGRHIAYSSGSRLVVTAPDWKETAFMVNIPAPEGESGDGEHVLDSISWVSPSAIAASSLWYDESAEDEQEGPDAYLLGITWDTWAATATAEPQGLKAKLTSYVNVANLDEYPGCGQHEWPYLRSVYVPAWKLLVHSHRKAFDEHIRLMELSDGEVFALEQSETKLMAAVPISEDGENFVIGMALDYSNQDSIYHPMDQEKPDVPASCILLVSTLDGVLRLYRLANFVKEPGLARPPLPVPSSLPQNVMNALAAARNALLEEESETSVSSPSPPIAGFMHHLPSTQSSTSGAAATAWSSSGAAAPRQEQQQRPPAVTTTLSQLQPAPEDAAAAVALPSEDESDLEDSESNAIVVDMGAGAATAVPAAAARGGGVDSAVASDEKAGDDGWGSSEEGEDSQEATSQPSGGARASLPMSALAKTASAPTFGVTTSTPPTTINSIFGSPTAFGTPPQPFGAASSTPAFSFATAGTAQNSSAGATTSGTAAGPFGGNSFGFGRPTISASPPAVPAISSAPAFGVLSTASSVAAPAGTTATTPAFSKSISAPSFGTLGGAAHVYDAPAATPLGTAAAAFSAPAPTLHAAASTTPVSGTISSGVVPASVSVPGSALPSSGVAISQPALGAVSPFGTPAFGAPAAAAPASSSNPATGLFGGVGSAVGSAFSQPAATAAQAASKGAFSMPPVVSAAEFQASPGWQGARAGYTFTTGTQGTGYYKDNAPQPAQAAAPQPTAAASQPDTRGTTSTATPAASQSRSPAGGGAAAAARRAGVQLHHQQQEAAKKLPVQVPAVKVAAPKPQLVGQGQEVADAEAAFLQSLHEVSTMSAQLQQCMNQLVPKDVDKWDLSQHTQQLRKQWLQDTGSRSSLLPS